MAQQLTQNFCAIDTQKSTDNGDSQISLHLLKSITKHSTSTKTKADNMQWEPDKSSPLRLQIYMCASVCSDAQA